MRNTIQKDIVKNAISDFNDHPTAEEVYTRIHEEYPSISKATVYRILKQSANAGEISRITLVDGADCYDKNTKKHYHIVCMKCGKMEDIELAYQLELNQLAEKESNYEILTHDVLFQGICKECKGES